MTIVVPSIASIDSPRKRVLAKMRYNSEVALNRTERQAHESSLVDAVLRRELAMLEADPEGRWRSR